MTEIRRADPAMRRIAMLIIAFGAIAGVILILVFERYDNALRAWILSEPGSFAQRVNLVFAILIAALLAPLLGFAGYLWSLGGAIVRAGEYPPPGMRVWRDTPVATGDRARFRGHLIKALALGCAAISVASGLLLWWLASFLGSHAA
jgi:hypothetical protein